MEMGDVIAQGLALGFLAATIAGTLSFALYVVLETIWDGH